MGYIRLQNRLFVMLTISLCMIGCGEALQQTPPVANTQNDLATSANGIANNASIMVTADSGSETFPGAGGAYGVKVANFSLNYDTESGTVAGEVTFASYALYKNIAYHFGKSICETYLDYLGIGIQLQTAVGESIETSMPVQFEVSEELCEWSGYADETRSVRYTATLPVTFKAQAQILLTPVVSDQGDKICFDDSEILKITNNDLVEVQNNALSGAFFKSLVMDNNDIVTQPFALPHGFNIEDISCLN